MVLLNLLSLIRSETVLSVQLFVLTSNVHGYLDALVRSLIKYKRYRIAVAFSPKIK